ncbi:MULTISPECIES: ABC transporter ATP-binding protein [unclassified Streptomyces]|uniref:ABC transporter transmembrane domain-containing protein n=1 Tax=unclassified Streptomyces TaxID=2593676 RepID=UPI000DDB1901|nr:MULTISPECIES: ABC transporter ATP-binding protein [unclassified Streptomyces]QZZ30315.1 ABC transporter ATP-binding protein [Streptomyces sp. ST1015]
MIDAYADPGTPGCRSGAGYLWWLTRCQLGRAFSGAALSSAWMALLAATPWMISKAVDEGIQRGDMGALVWWSTALLLVGAFNAWLSIMRHRTMTRMRMDANFRTVKVVVRQAVRLGAALPRRTVAGEVVTIGVGDVQTIAFAMTPLGPGIGAIVMYVVVAVLLLDVSPLLAAVVLTGMPVLALLVGPLMARLQGAETEYRERQRLLTARIGDLAGGLRVLNGLGGKGLFADGFRRDSAGLREQGYRVGAVTSWIQALGVGLPTLFLSVVTWLAARLAAQGEITVGQLVSVYGFVAVLVVPVSFLVELGYQLSRGVVAARRVVRLLALEPDPDVPSAEAPSGAAELYDPLSEVRVHPGELTAVVCARPADSAVIVDRLGRYLPSDVRWGEVRLDSVPLASVRARILVADNEADLFAETLREMVSGREARDVEAITRAVWAAASEDIVRGLPDGLDSAVSAQGRSLSGGQRQRVRLVRALLADPEVLLAVEPTSALDAHTEAAIAARLREARAGRTTVVTSTSPLLLDRVDRVQYVVEGRVAAVGSHRELLEREAGYRELVARDAGEDDTVRVGSREREREREWEGDVL